MDDRKQPAVNGKRNRRGPESGFYDKLKGKQVLIYKDPWNREDPIRAQLLWVDRYSLGIRKGSIELLIYKQHIGTIELAE